MAYKQLRQPNLSVTGYPGLCLNYARRVFNIGAKYPTAWVAWKNSKQHRTRTIPKNSVPLWFSYYKAGINYGHVVIYVPGKGLYSSPIGGRTRFASLAEFERFASNCKYVGWSEDINSVAIVKYVASTAPVYYTVRSGDTVSAICSRYGITITRFKQLNPGISDINKIYPGQRVRVK